MSRAQNDDTLELEDILSQPVKDRERFAAFMMRKLAENKPPPNANLFGNFKIDFDLDFELPLIKKSQPKAKVPEVQPLRELASAPEQCNNPPVDQATNENQPPLTSPTLSPNHRRSLRRSGNVPGSDKLRRHAIRRRSRSCGRQLLPEFEEAINLTRSLSSPVDFVPEISSTPCAEKPKDVDKKTVGNATEKPEKPAEKPAEKCNQPVEKPPARTSVFAAELKQICEERRNSFRNNVMQLDICGRSPQSRPSTPPSSSAAGLRRTYTMEKGPAPGQLLLSPSHRSVTSPVVIKSPVVKVKRIASEVIVPETPQRPSHEPAWQSQPQPEFVVPETQPQDLGELVQTLSRNASGPIVVINAANPNVSVRRDSAQVQNVPTSPVASPAKSFAAASSPKPKAQTSRVVENQDAIMTDDESDEQPSTAPLNLAPPGGNTTRQRRLRSSNRARVISEAQESSMRLLNLHRSDNAKKSRPRMTAIPLNKAPSAPINGEQFANELARMSNYEILDLRKRLSLNEVVPLNGQKRRSEKLIQQELLRRNMMDEADGLPRKPSSSDDSEEEYLPKPRRTRSHRRSSNERTQNGRSRSKRRELPMTEELKNYLGLSSTMEIRRKLSREGKRSLYTKGDSNVEDYDSSSPVKLPRLSRSIQIVPPPPASLRYSQSLQNLRRSSKFDFDDVVMAAPPGFHNTRNSDTIEIAPPPPEYGVNTRNKGTIGRKSHKEDLLPPPTEYEEHSAARLSRQSISSGRKTKENELVPPPIEYIEQPECEGIGEEICNDEPQFNLKAKQSGQKSNRESVVPPPLEYITQAENDGEIEEDRNCEQPRKSQKNTNKILQSKPTDQSTKDKAEHTDPPEPPENGDDDSGSDVEQPRRLRSRGNKSEHIKPSGQKAKKNGVVSVPFENNGTPNYVEDEDEVRNSEGRGEKSLQNLTKAKAQKDNVVPLTLECIKGPNDKASESISTTSASESSSGKKKRNQKSVSKSQNLSNYQKSMEADEVFTGNSTTREDEVIEKSEHMESLRVNTPTPPLDPKSSDGTTNNRSVLEDSLADDVPSTSRAALEALHRSQKMSRNQAKSQEVSNAEVVFKKPLAPAPRAKYKKLRSEVDSLKLSKITVDMEDTSGIRRSKRGQVPLQMNWCHTMDPRQFSFMQDFTEAPNKKSKEKKTNLSKTKKASATKPKKAVRDNSVADRGPLCSSTPRNVEKGTEAKQNSESLGISPLAWEDTEVQTVVEKVAKKRGRKKKPEEVVQTETQPEPEPEPMVSLATPLRSNQEEVTASCVTPFRNDHETVAEPEPIVPPVAPIRDEQEEASIQLMHWLRGVGEAQPTPSMSDENASVSPANDLVFSQVDGIDYAFYNTKERATLGYMRFQPHQTRNKKRAKVHPLKFIVQFGEFAVQTMAEGEEEEVHAILRVGDMIEVDKGSKYSIQNAIDDVSVLMVIRS
ncbi:microtubule-associated protein futsch [Drosophila takahashii]|uniref:microtubule-associated protein futsch n=1 Tax=Drosophila takahashii TaxID=29030 RepID=UPI0038993944